MNDILEPLKQLLAFLATLLAHPNALTIICAAALFLLGRHYWRQIDRKVRACESKHSKCERRLGSMVRLVSRVLTTDEAAYEPRRKGARRKQDEARTAVMDEVRRSLADLLAEIEGEEEDEEAALMKGAGV